MRLAFSPSSPWVRRVLVAAAELGLDDRMDKADLDFHDEHGNYAAINPMLKVPSLILDDGAVLIDSTAICEYLDMLHDGPKLFLPAGTARVARMQVQKMLDTMQDAATQCVGETLRRPEALRWQAFYDKQASKVTRGLDRMEEKVDALQDQIDYAAVSAGVMCGFLDFRLPDMSWRDGRSALASWFDEFDQRPSMQASRHYLK